MNKGRAIKRTYLPPNLRDLFDHICERLQLPEAEVLRLCILEYAERHNLLTEFLHRPVVMKAS